MKALASFLLVFIGYNIGFSQNCGTTQCMYWGNLNDKDYKKEILDKTDAIFYGKIISQSQLIYFEKQFPYRILKVKILRLWKGFDRDEAEVKFNYYDNDCAVIGESGKRLFYVVLDKDTLQLSTGQCSILSERDKQKLIRILGKGISL